MWEVFLSSDTSFTFAVVVLWVCVCVCVLIFSLYSLSLPWLCLFQDVLKDILNKHCFLDLLVCLSFEFRKAIDFCVCFFFFNLASLLMCLSDAGDLWSSL